MQTSPKTDRRSFLAAMSSGLAATVIAHENAKATIIGEGRPTALPDLTFSDTMTVTLGGKSVELTFIGASHSDNLIVMNFPAERTLFAVDIVSVRCVAY